MASVPVMPRKHEWTVDDLAHTPDDGLQYELVDGVLLVTPAPATRHQAVIGNLYLLMHAAATPDVRVYFAPVDFQPTRRRSLQPDLLVVRREDVEPANIRRPLLLAVEVLSPSTRMKDLLLKRAVYEESGVASYWVVDPDEPSLTAFELDGMTGRYAEVRHVVGDETWTAERPYPVTIRPADLLD